MIQILRVIVAVCLLLGQTLAIHLDTFSCAHAHDQSKKGLAEIPLTPLLSNPGQQAVDENELLIVTVDARARARVFAQGLPPGAVWDERKRRLTFQADSIQGGATWTVTLEARDGDEVATEQFDLTVNDTISPPEPRIVAVTERANNTEYRLEQCTDAWLDSPGYAGRCFQAVVGGPSERYAGGKGKFPVMISLHGGGARPGGTLPGVTEYRRYVIRPSDPYNQVWLGYSDQLPLAPGALPTKGTVPNYVQRRVIHLLEWTLRRFSHADPEQVSVSGNSMGGFGAMFFAISYARHLSEVNNRAGGVRLGATGRGMWDVWGSPASALPTAEDLSVWDYYDTSRALLHNRFMRDVYFSTVNGKRDTVVPFTLMIEPSPLTGLNFYQTLQREGIGHIARWAMSNHGGPDPHPMIKGAWSDAGAWRESYLRRDLPFPAFSNSNTDQDPNADPRGVLNRYFRWRSRAIVETRDRVEVPIRAEYIEAAPQTDPAVPDIGRHYSGPYPMTTDVTIRRLHRFQLYESEQVLWRFGDRQGVSQANWDGSVTVRQLTLGRDYQTLILSRAQ